MVRGKPPIIIRRIVASRNDQRKMRASLLDVRRERRWKSQSDRVYRFLEVAEIRCRGEAERDFSDRRHRECALSIR